ncbi:calcium-binding protein [Tychonema sp. LEGE 07203]|uniref:calcium-binding protein n=1 Tax=Tychonema sp. LEGE 07203 TaxID=1828671 RepID=UPI00188088B6|nr:calcium-binding protein [Tychonema sp. LEGE 07203]MBE9095001.1 calcium-binding protein [Tychonema sp. LEGE 07203]
MPSSPAVYENIAKQVAYIDDNPQFQTVVQTGLSAAGYQIDRTFDDPGTGFHAIGLISTTPDKPPVLVFRGFDGAIDEVANTDPRGIGFNQFEANKQALGNWLTQIGQDPAKNPNRLPPDVLGHSLGGALTQLAAAEFTSAIGDVVTFNSPGVDRSTVNTFTQKVGANNNVTHYIVSGDFVSLGGEAFLPGKVFLQTFTNPIINPLLVLDKHRQPNLLTTPPPSFTQTEISVDQLSSPAFTFTDSDYLELLAGLNFSLPQLEAALQSRSTFEQSRNAPGASFFGNITAIQNALAPSQPNYLLGDDANNTAFGFAGDDIIIGNGGNDTLAGSRNNDIISGGTGNDQLFGGKGDDNLNGGEGDDTLVGGLGSDLLISGSGRDVLVLGAGAGTDLLIDFQNGEDLIGLTKGLTFNQLRVSQGDVSTTIEIASSGEVLASIPGISRSPLTASDFISI